MFGETLTPVVSRVAGRADPARQGAAAGRRRPTSRSTRSPRKTTTKAEHRVPELAPLARRCRASRDLQPRRWLYLNFTYQQVQAALAGHGVALARVALVFEALQRGELVEPFGAAGRIGSPFSYWMLVAPAEPQRARR